MLLICIDDYAKKHLGFASYLWIPDQYICRIITFKEA